MPGKMIRCNLVENKLEVVKMFYYNESQEWHSYIHKNGGNVEENIKSTIDTISEYSEMYEVDVDGDLAAFFVRYEDEKAVVLEGFHIGKKYRTKEFVPRFWELVKGKMGGVFYTGVYEKNKQAFEHLIKQGFEFVMNSVDGDNKISILKLK